jgi:hypothetical protein
MVSSTSYLGTLVVMKGLRHSINAIKQHSVICILIVMLLVLATKENVKMNIGIKYTIEPKPFTSILFIKTYYAIKTLRPKNVNLIGQ